MLQAKELAEPVKESTAITKSCPSEMPDFLQFLHKKKFFNNFDKIHNMGEKSHIEALTSYFKHNKGFASKESSKELQDILSDSKKSYKIQRDKYFAWFTVENEIKTKIAQVIMATIGLVPIIASILCVKGFFHYSLPALRQQNIGFTRLSDSNFFANLFKLPTLNLNKTNLFNLNSLKLLILSWGGMVSLSKLIDNYMLKMPLDEFAIIRLMELYVVKRPHMPLALKAQIDEIFYNFFLISSLSQLTNIERLLDIALRIPLVKKHIIYDENKINESFKYYDHNTQQQLKDFVFNQVRNTKLNHDKIRKVHPLYLVGKAGTGKSLAATQIAEVLNVPIARLNLDGATIDDIVGLGFNTKKASPGLILEALTSNCHNKEDFSPSNQVLIIDEFDRVVKSNDPESRAVLSYMLKILDPDHLSFYSPFLGTRIRLPETIILTGNFRIDEFKSTDFEALCSRLNIVVFPKFSNKSKKDIAQEHIIPNLVEKFNKIKHPDFIFDETLNPNFMQSIQRFIDNDRDPGLRSLMKFIHNQLDHEHLNQYTVLKKTW